MRKSSGSVLKPLVSILTPTIPERVNFLAECRASVQAQTFRRWEHIIILDTEREGCSATTNRAAASAAGEWLLALAVDDLLLPGCLRALVDNSAEADVVYSPPLVWGEAPDQFHAAPPGIPATALIKREWWRAGYEHFEQEDRHHFERMMNDGARFVRVDQPAWVYRFHGGNKSRNNGEAS
jgi:glycosyltransferase involved in cell wall biosynthesis